MSKSSPTPRRRTPRRRTLTVLAVPALAIGTVAAVAQTVLPSAPGATAPAPAAPAVEAPGAEPVQFRGHGRRGGRGAQFMQFFSEVDADGSGTVTQAEIDAFLAAQLTAADVDGSGTVGLAEFETVYNQRTRARMVDAFQRLDDDGDGQIAANELSDRFGTLVERLDRNGDDALSRADRRGRGERGQRRRRDG